MSKENPWPLGAAERKNPGDERKTNRFYKAFQGWIAQSVSNLRFSLTLRIALHYAAQLLKTTLLVIGIMLTALWVSQLSPAIRKLDALAQIPPKLGENYSQEQLSGTPFLEVYHCTQSIPDTASGLIQRIRFAFSEFQATDTRRIMLSINTNTGSVVAVWNADMLVDISIVLFWVLLIVDLYRVVLFLQKRNRLNRKVLKPITDMAEMAATLSASNLSDRISVEGAKNELKDLALVINGMLDRIETSYNSQKQFVSDASHELRTPIAVIQGYAGMLERWGKTDKEVLDEGIAAISQEAASMKELVERLLFLARHDKKTLMLEMEIFDPLEVMSEIHREAKMLSAEHVFQLEPTDAMRIYADKDMIKQLMRILLDNAIKYTPAGGKITLGVRKERGNCVLSVTDTGAGISAEELPKVFERFYRCEEARKGQTSGHGLGLSIARIIVSAHKGKLKVRSKVGCGTTFFVQLPIENE